MFSLREYREPKSRLPDRLPWAFLVAPGVILQKDPVFQTTCAFRGPDLASSLDAELLSASSRINNALRRLGSGWGLFVEAQRFASSAYPESTWAHPAAEAVDAERRHGFKAEGAHFESSYYLTFTWRLPADRQERAAAFFYAASSEGPRDERASLTRELADFERSVREIVDILASVFPEVALLDDDQTLTYLHSTISTHRHPVRASQGHAYLDALLPDMAFSPGEPPMLGNHFVCTSTISGFPGTTLPGLLDALNHLPVEYRWMTRYLCLDKGEAKSLLEKYRRQWWSKRKGLWTMVREEATKQEASLIDNAAGNKAADADAALQELGDDLVSFGYLTTTVTVWDEDLGAARRKSQRVKEVIQSRGFTVRDETLGAAQAWLGSLPGHCYANVRRPIVHSLNLAHMMPLSAVWAGDPKSRHLESVSGVGTPHLLCSTTGSTPFRLHLGVGDVGHTLIIGPTGAGKSTLLGTLALGWLKYPGAQVIIFDKDRSARAATLAVGGTAYEPGSDKAPVAFQPLADIDQPAERVWAAQFIATLLAAQSVAVDHTVQAAIDATLTGLATAPRTQRTLLLFASHIGSHQRALREALRPYTLDGNHGQIFDGDHDDVAGGARWTLIEMGRLMGMGPAVVIPALEYLFHRVEGQFDGRPTLLVIDEAWLFLSHPVFASRLQGWLKTLRKKNVYVVFATQEVADATAKPELLSTILSACHTKIFLPDEEALTPAMSAAYAAIGLSSAEIGILSRARKKRDYYYRSVKGRRLFELGLGPAALALVGASSEADQQFMDEMVRTCAPADYARVLFERRGITWTSKATAKETGIRRDGGEGVPTPTSPAAVITTAKTPAQESKADYEERQEPPGSEPGPTTPRPPEAKKPPHASPPMARGVSDCAPTVLVPRPAPNNRAPSRTASQVGASSARSDFTAPDAGDAITVVLPRSARRDLARPPADDAITVAVSDLFAAGELPGAAIGAAPTDNAITERVSEVFAGFDASEIEALFAQMGAPASAPAPPPSGRRAGPPPLPSRARTATRRNDP